MALGKFPVQLDGCLMTRDSQDPHSGSTPRKDRSQKGNNSMSLLAVIVGVGVAAASRRQLPALVAALAVFMLTTGFLVAVAGPAGSEHGLTGSFWLLQAAILAVTVLATVGVARLRRPA